MFFRNLTFFLFPSADLIDRSDYGLEAGLDECQLKPVGPLEMSSRGFVSPFGRDCEELAHRLGNAIWLTVGGEDRMLPGAVVNDLLAKKLAAIEEAEGRKPGGRTRKRIKDELITELMPRAFVSPSRIDAYLDLGRRFIAIDTASRRAAENVCSEVRRALGSFPALPLNAEVSTRGVLTGWLAGEPLPEGLSIGDECELRDPVSQGAVVKCQRQELFGDEVAKHLESGKQCTRLALNYNGHVSFVFGEDLTVRKFKLLDGAVDKLESADRDDIRAELDARFALQVGEVGELFDVLAKTFKFSEPDAERVPPTLGVPSPEASTASGSTYSGIERVTITSAAGSVSMTGREFAEAPAKLKQFGEAVAIVRKTGNTGIAHLQRKLQIGYNAAARLIEAMEAAGILTHPKADGTRDLVGAAKEPA